MPRKRGPDLKHAARRRNIYLLVYLLVYLFIYLFVYDKRCTHTTHSLEVKANIRNYKIKSPEKAETVNNADIKFD